MSSTDMFPLRYIVERIDTVESLKDYYVKPKENCGLIYMYVFENGLKYIGQTTNLLSTRHYRHTIGKAPVDDAIRNMKYELYILCEVEKERLNE